MLFAGVYYHLKNPMLALQRIRRLLADRGVLFIEGASTTDYLAEQLNKALGLRKSKMGSTAGILDRLPLSYFDFDHKIYEHWSNWFFPTTRCLEGMLLDSGFQNVFCELKQNAFYNYSHRRLMGRAEANPAKSDPSEQKHESPLVDRAGVFVKAGCGKKSDPSEQKHEHALVGDLPASNQLSLFRPASNRFSLSRRLLARLPPNLQQVARRIRRAVLARF